MTSPELRDEHRTYLLPPWQWRPLLRRVRGIPKPLRYILATAADFAGKDGTEVHPGIALLAIESESSYEQVQDALRLGRKLGLIWLAHRGNRRKGLADEYWLIAHPELLERADVESPDVRKLRAEQMRAARVGRVSKSRAEKTGAPVVDGPVDRQYEASEDPIRGSGGPSIPEFVDGRVDRQMSVIDGLGDRHNPVIDGPVDPPTSPVLPTSHEEMTSPPDEVVLHGPVTLRANGPAEEPMSVDEVVEEHPYDRAALLANLRAASTNHRARASPRINPIAEAVGHRMARLLQPPEGATA